MKRQAFLSMLPQEHLSSLLDNLQLEKKTVNTITNTKSMEKALAKSGNSCWNKKWGIYRGNGLSCYTIFLQT